MHTEHESHKVISIVYGILILFLFVGLGYGLYAQHVANQLLQEEISLLDQELVSGQAALTEKIQTLEQQTQINLDAKAAEIYDALEKSNLQQSKQLKGLSTNLIQLEEQSKTQLGKLESQILDINVKTESFTAIIEKVVPAVVRIKTDKGLGSGVIVDSNGFVVTNYHVVQGIKKMGIVTSDGKQYSGAILSYHEGADIAVLKISLEDETLTSLKFEDLEDIKVGQKVIALGSPLGLDFTVTEGIVSSVDRKNPSGYQIIQTDVSINPGNSGGPLINANSRIVGINTFKAQNSEGIGFAMNPDTVEDVVQETIKQYEASQQPQE